MTKRDNMSKEILAKLEKMNDKLYDIDKKVGVMQEDITNIKNNNKEFKERIEKNVECNENDIKNLKEFTAKIGTYITILIIVVSTVVTAVVGKILEVVGLK